MALTTGGGGNMEIRIVKKRDEKFDHRNHNLVLFFEALHKSMINGRMTEIIEAPEDVIQNLEFEITDIDMETAQTDEMRKATFVEQVLNPMFNFYIPAGIADPAKVFLRHMEKLGEHPVDFASEKVLSQIMATYSNDEQFKIPQQQQGNATAPPGAGGPQQGAGSQQGNMQQSGTGTKFGMQNTQPISQ